MTEFAEKLRNYLLGKRKTRIENMIVLPIAMLILGVALLPAIGFLFYGGVFCFFIIIYNYKIRPTRKNIIINILFVAMQTFNIVINLNQIEKLENFYVLGTLSITILHFYYNYEAMYVKKKKELEDEVVEEAMQYMN